MKHLKSFLLVISIYLPASRSHLGNVLRNLMPGAVLGTRDTEISETEFLFSVSPTVWCDVVGDPRYTLWNREVGVESSFGDRRNIVAVSLRMSGSFQADKSISGENTLCKSTETKNVLVYEIE